MANEREWAEPAEIDVAQALKGVTKPPHIEIIAENIRAELNAKYAESIINAEWIGGNDYANPGDIRVQLDTKKVSIEMKFSKSSGRGTVKNPGSAHFTNHVSNSILSYKDFDEVGGFKEKRYALIESKFGTRPRSAAEYARILRHQRHFNPTLLEDIERITSPGQEAYAEYVSDQLNSRLPEVNIMIQKILNISFGPIPVHYCIVKEFGSAAQTVEFLDFVGNNTVVKVVNSGKSIKFINASGKDVVRFSVHWKNICQGGQSPCFNVFVGNEY